MNKQEYKLLSEEIMTLTANEQFQDAAEIADRIDWRKVRSFSMLMKISELYQLNRRYEDALELMLMAYDHNPKSRDIVYSLCELYILLENHVKALEFLALYKRMAPHDPGVYILQYKLQELEGAALEENALELFGSSVRFPAVTGMADETAQAAVNARTPEQVRGAAKDLLEGNLVEIVMRPE